MQQVRGLDASHHFHEEAFLGMLEAIEPHRSKRLIFLQLRAKQLQGAIYRVMNPVVHIETCKSLISQYHRFVSQYSDIIAANFMGHADTTFAFVFLQVGIWWT